MLPWSKSGVFQRWIAAEGHCLELIRTVYLEVWVVVSMSQSVQLVQPLGGVCVKEEEIWQSPQTLAAYGQGQEWKSLSLKLPHQFLFSVFITTMPSSASLTHSLVRGLLKVGKILKLLLWDGTADSCIVTGDTNVTGPWGHSQGSKSQWVQKE